MSSNTNNEDLRSLKTKKAIYSAIFSLLKKTGFRKITVKEICDKALVSRATFYSHFIDKYELLKHWLTELWQKNLTPDDAYKQVAQLINSNMRDCTLVLKNVFYDADNETYNILFEFILSTASLTAPKIMSGEDYSKHVVLSNFYAGGLISYMLWQVLNSFPREVPILNGHLFEMIQDLQKRK